VRGMGEYLCRACKHVWLGPWPVPGCRCPKCHSENVVLKDGSVRHEDAPLQ
jgi:Zn finger protein HypA/HybF involved in hydrogenase expression